MQVAHALRRVGWMLRNAFAREALELDQEAPPRAKRARSLARALFAVEELPFDPEPAPARGLARASRAGHEELGVEPERVRPARGRGVLRALFAPERLPEDPPEAPRPARHRWLSWLLVPESLDPPRR